MENVIKGSTKKGQRILAMARPNIGSELYHVYGSYSAEKAKAMDNCKAECGRDHGYNFHICSRNSSYFVVAWNYNDETTGEVMTVVKTGRNVYVVDGSRA